MKNSVKSSINQRLFKIVALSAVLLDAAGLSLPVYANSSTSDINVSANTSGSCIISNTDLNFGAYEVIAANATQDLTAFATISTTCTSGANGVITMSGGSHPLYCVSSKCYRRMANEGETSFLNYNIYTNESYSWSNVWSDNTSATREIVQMMGAGVSQNTTVYGEIPKNQKNAVAGSYTDTVNITLIY